MGKLGKRLPVPFYKTLIIKFIVETRLYKITTLGKPKIPLLQFSLVTLETSGRESKTELQSGWEG